MLWSCVCVCVCVILHHFIHCSFLRPGKNKAHNHQQTQTVTQPVYDEEMVFQKVAMDTLSTYHVLEVAVWDAEFITYPMGVIRLGPQPTADSKPWMDSQV